MGGGAQRHFRSGQTAFPNCVCRGGSGREEKPLSPPTGLSEAEASPSEALQPLRENDCREKPRGSRTHGKRQGQAERQCGAPRGVLGRLRGRVPSSGTSPAPSFPPRGPLRLGSVSSGGQHSVGRRVGSGPLCSPSPPSLPPSRAQRPRAKPGRCQGMGDGGAAREGPRARLACPF